MYHRGGRGFRLLVIFARPLSRQADGSRTWVCRQASGTAHREALGPQHFAHHETGGHHHNSMLLKTVESGKLQPRKLVTRRFTMHDTMKAYDTFGNAAKEDALKVVLTNGESR